MRRNFTLFLLMLVTGFAFAQQEPHRHHNETFLKAGIGTSWIILPKVFLISAADPSVQVQILPATNGFATYAGIQKAIYLGSGWAFVPEINLNFVDAQIRVNYTNPNLPPPDTINASQRSQSYVRAELPINFAVFSRDNFWVSFGPNIYFNLYDNKGFEEAVTDLWPEPDFNLDSRNPVGVRFRLAVYAPIGERSYVDIKFESDLGSFFKFEDDAYKAKFSFQNISIGYGFGLNKR